MRRLAIIAVLALVPGAHAATVFDGDPVDSGSGRPYAILPGVPLILPQADGRFRPPIVVPGTVGDADIVVRAGDVGIGPVMPAPVATPPTVVDGGTEVTSGGEVPFTVIAAAADGTPLGGASLDGIPVIVAAWADLDGDGFVGPTGAGNTNIQLQEAEFLVGRQVAVFSGGIAQGGVAVWKAAPASAGGLRVVLTALAFVGPFSPGFLEGNVPDGPGVATLLPFFPRLDPDRIVDGEGRGGPASPAVRIGVELEPAFAIPVGDPQLGTPFALPTGGSSPTIDRAIVVGGAMTRAQFVVPAPPGPFTDGEEDVEAPIKRGAGGELLAPQTTAVTLADDGPGNGVTARMVPVDLLDQVTDPSPGATVLLVAGPGLSIVDPNADGDPSRETVPITATGVTITLDDAGGTNDSGAASTLAVVAGGAPTETLAVTFTGGPVLPPDSPPAIAAALLADGPSVIGRRCPSAHRLVAVVNAPDAAPATVTANVTVDGAPVTALTLQPGLAPPGITLPAGPVYAATLALTQPSIGTLQIAVAATNTNGAATPLTLSVPVVAVAPPVAASPALSIAARTRKRVTVDVSASVRDDCGVRRVAVEMLTRKKWRRIGKLRDDGKKGDPVGRDGVYTGVAKVPVKAGMARLRITARNVEKLTASGPETTIDVTR
jgi:hypothetical protein